MCHRKIEAINDSGRTYYLPTKILNIADEVHCDTHDPNSRGYGGSTFQFKLEDGTTDTVKGPWHCSATIEEIGLNLSELHKTRVLLLDPTNDDAVLYEEKEFVLGAFYRGDRIAQQLSDATNKSIYIKVESAGGSHSHTCNPGDNLHPLAERKNTTPVVSLKERSAEND